MRDYPNEPAGRYAVDRAGGLGGWAAVAIVVALIVVVGVFLFMTAEAPPEPDDGEAAAGVVGDHGVTPGDPVEVEAEVARHHPPRGPLRLLGGRARDRR